MTETSIHKHLLKSGAIAKFTKYKFGKLYYEVELEDGMHEFPIDTVEETKILIHDANSATVSVTEVGVKEDLTENPKHHENYFDEMIALNLREEEVYPKRLSKDLGDTTFHAEVTGSELNRWIKKAFKDGTLINLGY